VTGLAIKFIENHPNPEDLQKLGKSKKTKTLRKSDDAPVFYMNYASWNHSSVTNATFIMDQPFPRDYLYSSSEKLNSLAYITFGSILLFACMFIKEQRLKGYSIDFSVTVATTLMAGLIINLLC
jgi:hypothetical protein